VNVLKVFFCLSQLSLQFSIPCQMIIWRDA
jgi:hypothetical protein